MIQELYLIFDGVENTVFYSQIYQQIKQKVERKELFNPVIISFEKDPLQATYFYNANFADLKTTNVFIWQRMPLLGKWTLHLAAHRLKNFLAKNPTQKVICRGEAAAYILLKSIEFFIADQEVKKKIDLDETSIKNLCNEIEILIPGLASFEVLLKKKEQGIALLKSKIKMWFLFNLCTAIEQVVFSVNNFWRLSSKLKVTYVFASKALKDYAIQHFELLPYICTVSEVVIDPIDWDKKMEARVIVRTKHGIDLDANIYCYSGGMQPWQSFDLCIEAFLEFAKKDEKAFFLVLTHHAPEAQELITQFKVPAHQYLILKLKPELLHTYHLACDFGMIFREANIVNWTSRPIKVIEYKQAGLLVLHNFTIEWVIQSC